MSCDNNVDICHVQPPLVADTYRLCIVGVANFCNVRLFYYCASSNRMKRVSLIRSSRVSTQSIFFFFFFVCIEDYGNTFQTFRIVRYNILQVSAIEWYLLSSIPLYISL